MAMSMLLAREEVKAPKYSKMAINIRGNGTQISRTERALFGIKMATGILVSGLMGKLMGMVSILLRMGLLTREAGSMIFKKEMAKRLGLINQFSREITKKDQSTGKENISMQMGQFMVAIGVIIKYLGKELILGPMERILKDNGLITTCMVTVLSRGQMEDDTKVIT